MYIPLLIATTLLTGCSVGLLFGFACAVMPGLRRCDDATFVQAMRHINDAILNPWFYTVFIGAIPALVITLIVGIAGDATTWPVIAATVLYLTAIGITGGVNIPLNNRLLADAPTGDPRDVRAHFEAKWTRWHLVRTVAGIIGFGFLCVAFTV